METLITFADRLNFALAQKDARPVDLARALHMTRPAVSQLLSGKNKGMRPEHLVRAADWLGVRIKWLATGEGEMRPRRLTPQQQELLLATNTIPDDLLTMLVSLLHQANTMTNAVKVIISSSNHQ